MAVHEMSRPLRHLADAHNVRFGTSGVRGLVADLSDAVCYAYTQAFLKTVATGSSRIVVGHDLRPSSPRIAAACIQAMRDVGREAVYVGGVPTPALAYYCALHGSPGIVVTGSHIPFDRNDIKFYRADGEIAKADEQAILDSDVAVPDGLTPADLPTVDGTALEAYIGRYTGFFGEGTLAGLRIALYEHSSVARDVLRSVLERLGAEVLSLGRTDVFVPIDTEAVRAEDITQARAWAQAHRFDAILSTDGDADRPLIGDETGTWLRGDVVGILCAQYLRADVVVTPVSSNTAVEQCGSFRQVVRTRIGSPYVIANMGAYRDGGRVVGYEANGGFLLGSDVERGDSVLKALPTRDSVLPMLALLAIARLKGLRLSELGDDLPRRFTASDRIQSVPTDLSRALMGRLEFDARLAARLMAPDAGEVVALDTTDGLRATFASGEIVHLRPSGNAPELRCYAEAPEGMRASTLCDRCLTRLSSYLHELHHELRLPT
ncbi:phosphomannomutase [Thauera sp.]|jgi:phosphomannomutase|uniref:phosphomannomutase n=1 Tax=Thauera sp. TaxID=1905334 RepID=UPI002A362FF4|nr:phosphomannomutase [Thauera sp.]MDX9885998.1 phosphomannomutase [Thauera sp.]